MANDAGQKRLTGQLPFPAGNAYKQMKAETQLGS